MEIFRVRYAIDSHSEVARLFDDFEFDTIHYSIAVFVIHGWN